MYDEKYPGVCRVSVTLEIIGNSTRSNPSNLTMVTWYLISSKMAERTVPNFRFLKLERVASLLFAAHI